MLILVKVPLLRFHGDDVGFRLLNFMTDKCLNFYVVTYFTSYILWEELKYFKIVVLRNLSYVGTSYVRKNFVMFHISMEKIFFNHKSQLKLLYECIVCDT